MALHHLKHCHTENASMLPLFVFIKIIVNFLLSIFCYQFSVINLKTREKRATVTIGSEKGERHLQRLLIFIEKSILKNLLRSGLLKG